MRTHGAAMARLTLAVTFVLAVLGIIQTSGTAAAVPNTQPYVDAGKTVALALTTIDYRTVDRDVQHVLDNATDPFYSNFKQRSAEFTQAVLNAKSTSIGSLDDEARMESFDDGRARVFAALTVTTTNVGQPPPPPRQWRLIITVQKVGEGYKASGVEFMR